ncbi:YcgL domain-containing protein [Rodentibacter pneumotropicus]|uniref:YcgL domain-containing protein D3M76_09155 n=1 Tax=Rodentibacter pneumotropicus TaxID=758 RepID=A0A4S2PG13_9PAST|nr:YcgL domain-containing protein [Rodentibacter pneumotropicus]MDC2824793.1 YcgL domain-containing protein [Rodentibacter pneumotropicus]THA00927.1 YcgL domain-containing protein [Rodentibacter pneumotropicus]THA02139.1 YcgL domain-containing protein [Rodentibacter pneumotropicus]THA09737.1 YcgL domain-containing protein [Rodentibacter pneumotropicus]THA13277.1 YcgL domain-containing protein [Rodentibacter pneumotropicus]
MLCAIYKSKKKPGSYLYIQKRDDFSAVPGNLLEYFGKPELVMMFNLSGNKPLYHANKNEVEEKIRSQGFYLQIPKQDDGLFNSLSEIK